MSSTRELAPGVPRDYYERILRNEEDHWWYAGMLALGGALLGERLSRPGLRLLDAGCGTGGFLRWARERTPSASLAGVDVASAAIALAADSLPKADLRVAPLRSLPFDGRAFDVVVSHDVLQHVHEDDLEESLAELRRVLDPSGVLLLRTNGSRSQRREREDWRVYDRRLLQSQLEQAGFAVERLTHANTVLSAYATLRGRSPRAPSEHSHGIPPPAPPRLAAFVGSRALAAEAFLVARGATLTFGHTLFARAVPA
jgi:SAM-dependent methyltransferase